MIPSPLTIDGDRLWRSLMELAEIGAYHDERTGLRGVNRLALTDADAEGRRLSAHVPLLRTDRWCGERHLLPAAADQAVTR